MRGVIAAVAVLLGGCAGGSGYRAEALFDLGPQTATTAAVPVAGVEVIAPLWLTGSAMQYRLLYADPARRFEYAESRWVASPDELVQRALEQLLGTGGPGPCRLRVDIFEFAQVFDSPTASRFVLEGRATLVAAPEQLASRTFSVNQEAASADARGGVAAAATAVQRAGLDLATWLASVGSRCRAG